MLAVEVEGVEGSLGQVSGLCHFHASKIELLVLLVQNEYVAMISSSFRWDRLHVGNDDVAFRQVRVGNISAAKQFISKLSQMTGN